MHGGSRACTNSNKQEKREGVQKRQRPEVWELCSVFILGLKDDLKKHVAVHSRGGATGPLLAPLLILSLRATQHLQQAVAEFTPGAAHRVKSANRPQSTVLVGLIYLVARVAWQAQNGGL